LVSDRMLYVILRSLWCGIVLNVHVPAESRIDYMKYSFYEEVEYVFNKFPK
jgi:5-methylcytosine-specific restriction endonuclease McrBC regulatory subunit McrC